MFCGILSAGPRLTIMRKPASTVTVNPLLLGFTVVNVGSTSNTQVVTVTNGTASTITFTSIAINGTNPGDFAITTKTCSTTLAATKNCTITVDFKPTANDIREANLAIAYSGASGSPQNVGLTGFGQAATQTLIFNPAVLTFPLTNVGSTGSQQPINVYNFGTTGVTFSGATLIGPNASDFAISTNGCSSLNPGQGSCTLYVTFTPTAGGLRTGSVQINSNSSGGPNVVLLLGTGQVLTQNLTVLPLSFNFGLQDVGGSSSANYITVSNVGTSPVTMNGYTVTGTNPTDFAISSNNCPTLGLPLAAGSTCYIYLTFTPQAAGTRTATLNVMDTATGSPQTIPIYGVGQNVNGAVAFQKSTVDLGVETLHVTSGQQYIQVMNTGDINITFSSVLLGGGNSSDFAISSNGCTSVAPGSSCYVYVSFTPTATGQRNATLNFTDNATGSPQSVSLTGTGVTATQQLAFNYLGWDFGALALGSTSSQQYFQVDNLGDSNVSLTSVALTGTNSSDFTINSNGCSGPTLNAGSSCYIYLSFTPSATGLRTATLQFTDSASGSPQSIGLSGVGVAATQTLSYNNPALVFPGWPVNTNYGAISLAITNTGDQAVTFSNAGITGSNANSFSVSSNGCSTLNPANTCYISINYFPANTGVLSANLQLTDSATGSPQNIPLSGDGEPSGGVLSLGTTLENFGSVNMGSTSSPSTVTITNSSGGPVSFTQNIVGPNAADYNTTNNTCTGALNTGANCQVTLDVTPGGLGARLAALEFTTNGVAQDVLLAVVGTAAQSAVSVPANLDFGLSNTGSPTSQKQIQLTNSGTLPVTFSTPSISGTNAADFAIAYDQCTQLAVGQNCNMALVFTPGAGGVRTATLQIKDSATGSPQSVVLSGIGQPGAALLSVPANIDLGTTNQGSPLLTNVTLFNAGTAALTIGGYSITGTNASDFTVTQRVNCATISAFSSCSIQLGFTPGGTGVRTATLQITSNGTGSPQSIILTGVGLATTALISAPTALSFPATVTGTSNQQSLYIYNIGTTTVTITTASISGTNAADFSLYTSCTQINVNGSCYTQVNFTPSAAGVRTATLNITSNATGSPTAISLSGVGQTPVARLSLPQAIAFPTTTVGTSNTQSFNLFNTGNQTVNFTSIKVTGAFAPDFTVNYQNCSSVAPNGSCYIQVTLASVPGGAGVVSASVQFTDNALGSPQSVLLTAIIDGPTTTIGLSPGSLTFAPQSVGTVSGQQSITVYNDGLGPVTIKNATITGTNAGDFFITGNTCTGVTLLGGNLNACYLYVQFAPTATGSRTATLQVSDTAVGGTQSATLTGTGQ